MQRQLIADSTTVGGFGGRLWLQHSRTPLNTTTNVSCLDLSRVWLSATLSFNPAITVAHTHKASPAAAHSGCKALLGWWNLQPALKRQLPVPIKYGQLGAPLNLGRPCSLFPINLDFWALLEAAAAAAEEDPAAAEPCCWLFLGGACCGRLEGASPAAPTAPKAHTHTYTHTSTLVNPYMHRPLLKYYR